MKSFLRKTTLQIILVTLFFSFMVAVHPAAASEMTTDLVNIQILTMNDFHGALVENGKNPGAAKIAQYLKVMKGKNPNGTLILSAGDMFQGSPDSNLLYGKTVVEVMNAVGFDAMTIGNHEFDWGVAILKERIAQSHFPYISANILDKKTGKSADFVTPYTIFERDGIKIAVIGLTTPETAYKSSPKVMSAYLFEDPAKTVNALIPELKKKNADVIIVLSHMSSFMDKTTGEITGEVTDMLENTNHIDAVISGHSHQFVHGTVNGVPIVQANYFGRAVGKINFLFKKSTRQILVSSADTIPLPFDGLTAEKEVEGIINKAQIEIAPVKNTILGSTIRELSHDREAGQLSLLGQWTADAMREATAADIAFENAGGIRTNIPAGNITMGKLYEVFPFDNTLVTVEMTGAQVMKVLHHGIGNRNIGMVQFSGLKVIYDREQTDDQRIKVTLLDGTPLDLTRNYKIVMNDFMAAGGDNFTMFKEGNRQTDTYIPLRDMFVTAIKKLKIIDFNGDNRFMEIKPTAMNVLAIAA
ncbi:bifunctional metallophosphatase/5'-nucleotidase [Pelosinus sp. sgz500959]|uniref:bifunctional metallophosphatase/5'-nucleotidase n=1 Tax=Pelosinus sp. sgz500959 TaxID=3242472 RepID=UPI00367073C4